MNDRTYVGVVGTVIGGIVATASSGGGGGGGDNGGGGGGGGGTCDGGGVFFDVDMVRFMQELRDLFVFLYW